MTLKCGCVTSQHFSCSVLCQPKERGGLGIQNLDIQNKCLLRKWLFQLCNEDVIWQELIIIST
jgi:hypothetical protein